MRWALGLLVLLLAGQTLATLRADNRFWPFHTVKVYTHAEDVAEAPLILLFRDQSETSLVQAGWCKEGMSRKLGRRLYHARPASQQQMLDDLVDFYTPKRATFEGLRLYRITFSLSEQEIVKRELLLESRW